MGKWIAAAIFVIAWGFAGVAASWATGIAPTMSEGLFVCVYTAVSIGVVQGIWESRL